MSDEIKFFPYKPPIDVEQLKRRVDRVLSELETKRSNYKNSVGATE